MNADQTRKNIIALRMERQYLTKQASEEEYIALYRDLQPGQNAYWHGFGQPPLLVYRAAFDDTEFNRGRQLKRDLLKGRFQGGNLGWVMAEEMELFCCLYRKPLEKLTFIQEKVLEVIEQMGPVTIQQIKEETGLLVKEITPALHRFQEACLVYEDQNDGDWERGWYRFEEMFPELDLNKYTKREALRIVLERYAYRMVYFTAEMVKSFYKVTAKDLKSVLADMVAEQVLVVYEDGYLLKEDWVLLRNMDANVENEIPAGGEKQNAELSSSLQAGAKASLYLMHRNDILVKSYERSLKEKYQCPGYEALYYVLINGEFHGAILGKYTFSTDVIAEIIVDKDFEASVEQIIEDVHKMPGCRESVVEKVSVR